MSIYFQENLKLFHLIEECLKPEKNSLTNGTKIAKRGELVRLHQADHSPLLSVTGKNLTAEIEETSGG